MSQRHKWLGLSLLTIAAAMVAAAPAPVAAQQPKEVEIAMIVPLSGPWARQGVLERMGAVHRNNIRLSYCSHFISHTFFEKERHLVEWVATFLELWINLSYKRILKST